MPAFCGSRRHTSTRNTRRFVYVFSWRDSNLVTHKLQTDADLLRSVTAYCIYSVRNWKRKKSAVVSRPIAPANGLMFVITSKHESFNNRHSERMGSI